MLDLIIAAVAGFVSFISPCVLPLVPAYIGYMGGRVTNTVSNQVAVSTSGGAAVIQSPSLSMRFNTFVHGLAFVSGFTFIFVLLGLLGTAFVQMVGSTAPVEGVIGRVGGILVIFFGLHFMGALQWLFNRLRARPALLANPASSILFAVFFYVVVAWGFTETIALWDTGAYPMWAGLLAILVLAGFYLYMFTGGAFTDPAAFWNNFLGSLDQMLYADTRRQITNPNRGLSSSALMGIVFAAGWTPCIGPTLGLAFTQAANGGDLGHATGVMIAYSLGLGIPFLITALALDSAQGVLRNLKKQMATLKLVSGGFLVFIGVLVTTGQLQAISRQFSVQFGDFSLRVEECIIGTLEGDIYLRQTGVCLSGDQSFRDLVAENTGETLNSTIVPAGEVLPSGENVDDAPVNPVNVPVDVAENPVLDTGSVSSILDVAAQSTVVEGLGVGNLAPNFETVDVQGNPVTLRDYRGNVVLLNFWFTECAPCRVEMPEFERVYNAHKDDGLVILAVNREESAAAVQAFADELGLTFPMALDEAGDVNFQYSVFGYPSTFVIDRDGVIQFKAFNALTEAQIQDIVADALAAS
ncbi:MAG: hypothetical protein OHK0046_00900 [Anaerolineae bacterium]